MAWSLSACAGTGSDPYPPAPNDAADKVVFVVDHGLHTGIILNRQEVDPHLPALRGAFPDVAYLEFGWGDERFYQADAITSGLKIQAILWPTRSVLHVVEVPDYPKGYFAATDVVEITVSKEGYERLAAYINASFVLDENFRGRELGEGLYGNSRFYRAQGNYHLFNTCNHWTAEALDAAGLPINPGQALTADGVMDQVRAVAGDDR